MKARSPNCRHVSCSQHFIDTGDIECLHEHYPAEVARIIAGEGMPITDEVRAGVHEVITVGEQLIFRQADGRVITIKARNRNPMDDALSAVIAFACGALVALLVSLLLRTLQ